MHRQRKPQTTLAVEPKRTEAGIEYNLYLENTNCLSTLFFEMNFDGKNVGKATLEKNECFDILHTTWNTDNRISVKDTSEELVINGVFVKRKN